MPKNHLILEIYTGSGSIRKVANKLGYDVISFHIDPKIKLDVDGIISYIKDNEMRIPNFIWVSVPCNTLINALEIVKYFENLDKNLKWVIENPIETMRRQPIMKKNYLATTSYCMYGDERNKPTDFFNNFHLKLKPLCTSSKPHATKEGMAVLHVKDTNLCRNDRFKIPNKLITTIFDQAFGMGGEGLYDWIKSKFLEKRPKILNDLLEKEGNQIINKISVCRKPVQSIIQKALNVLSLGAFKKNMKKLGYDNVFHLYMVVHLANGSIWSLEKNQRVNVIKGAITGGDCQEISYGKKTLSDFILTAESRNIPGFYRYDAFKDNCQKWIKDIMNSNDINNLDSFILQDVDTLAPALLKKFARGVTDIAGVADYVFRGGSWDV